MKKIYCLLLLTPLFFVFIAYGEEMRITQGIYKNKEVEFVEGEILVKFKNESESRIIKVLDGTVVKKVQEYLQRSDVEYAQPNFIYAARMKPTPYSSIRIAEGILNGEKIEFIEGEIRVKYKGEENERIIKVPEGQVIQKVLEWRKKQETDKNIQYVEPNTIQEYDMECD